ncbi:MAG: hypothetical protein HFI26_09525 [Lachnospiraceae bacterium]|nr:hypothetical protein [Lachnospiraceae bacterium]
MGRVCGNALYYAWTGPEQSSTGGFSISCVRTVRVQGVCSCRTYAFGVFGRLRLLDFFCVCPPISDTLYANSRTLDIGKASGGRLLRSLVLGAVG